MIGEALLAGAAAGLASIPHCGAMCGPLAGFACARSGAGPTAPWRYQLGRFVGYGALGIAAGALGGAAATLIAGRWGAALISWSLAAALAVAAIRAWQRGGAPKSSGVALSGGDAPSLFERAVARMPSEPALFGATTALLPCGALAAAVGLAAATGTALDGFATMIAFAAVSGVALVGAAWVTRRLASVDRRSWSRALAIVLMMGALALVARPIPALVSGDPAAPCHEGRAVMSVPS
ncbi:MAG: sulfite exporter TauE/SafE family protein [bacterium]